MIKNKIFALFVTTLFGLSSCQKTENIVNKNVFDVQDLREKFLRDDGQYGYISSRANFIMTIYSFDFLENEIKFQEDKNNNIEIFKIGDYRLIEDDEEVFGNIFVTNFSNAKNVDDLLVNLITTIENPPYGINSTSFYFSIGANWSLVQRNAYFLSLDGANFNYGYFSLLNFLYKNESSGDLGGEYLFSNFATISPINNSRTDYLSFSIGKSNEFIPLNGYLPNENISQKDNKVSFEGFYRNSNIEENKYALSYDALNDSPSITSNLSEDFCPYFKFDYTRSNDISGNYADYSEGQSFQGCFSTFNYLINENIPTIFSCNTTISISHFEEDLAKIKPEQFKIFADLSNF